MKRLLYGLCWLAMVLASTARAHEVRPAYLEIHQQSATRYKITWKQPTMGDYAIHLVPHLSNGWLERTPDDQYAAGGFLIRTWNISAAKSTGLSGVTVSIEGLKDTITDAFVRIRLQNGQKLDRIVRPESPRFKISLSNGNAMSLRSFVLLGIEHILTGPDHLSFVLALVLIVRDKWMLLKTVSAFTVSHSVTLAAATFGAINLPVPLLNSLIALSILFVAPEVMRARSGGTSLTIRYPWIVAFAFGLVHGMGFASGLTSLGLERSVLVEALVTFNLGVEIGQLTFVALVLLLMRSFDLMEIRWPRPIAMAPTYGIGILGAMWTFRYGAMLFGVA